MLAASSALCGAGGVHAVAREDSAVDGFDERVCTRTNSLRADVVRRWSPKLGLLPVAGTKERRVSGDEVSLAGSPLRISEPGGTDCCEVARPRREELWSEPFSIKGATRLPPSDEPVLEPLRVR